MEAKTKDAPTYRHKEAFCLMWYACPCGHRERIWNSRDGVTPFGGLRCVSCNSTTNRPPEYWRGNIMPGSDFPTGMTHVDFHLDKRAVDHKPNKGQLIFRDGTKEEAVAIILKRIERCADAGRPIPIEVQEILLKSAERGEAEWLPGWPTVDRTE